MILLGADAVPVNASIVVVGTPPWVMWCWVVGGTAVGWFAAWLLIGLAYYRGWQESHAWWFKTISATGAELRVEEHDVVWVLHRVHRHDLEERLRKEAPLPALRWLLRAKAVYDRLIDAVRWP